MNITTWPSTRLFGEFERKKNVNEWIGWKTIIWTHRYDYTDILAATKTCEINTTKKLISAIKYQYADWIHFIKITKLNQGNIESKSKISHKIAHARILGMRLKRILNIWCVQNIFSSETWTGNTQCRFRVSNTKYLNIEVEGIKTLRQTHFCHTFSIQPPRAQ